MSTFIGKRRVWKGGVPHLELNTKIMGGVVKFKWGISDLFPRYLGGYFALYEQNKCAHDAAGIGVANQCRHLLICCALDWRLQPVLLDSTTSSCCCTFSSNVCVAIAEQLCSNSWQINFVEGKIWDHPSKTTQEWPKLGGGVILWYK